MVPTSDRVDARCQIDALGAQVCLALLLTVAFKALCGMSSPPCPRAASPSGSRRHIASSPEPVLHSLPACSSPHPCWPAVPYRSLRLLPVPSSVTLLLVRKGLEERNSSLPSPGRAPGGTALHVKTYPTGRDSLQLQGEAHLGKSSQATNVSDLSAGWGASWLSYRRPK